jgi:hypothetical protein
VTAALGARMHSLGMVVRGTLSRERWIEMLHAVARAVGMTPVGKETVCYYPVDGKGGTGQTIFLPITESFLILDTWSDHDGAYLFVCSCRPYFSADVDKVAQQFGLKIALNGERRFYRELSLA